MTMTMSYYSKNVSMWLNNKAEAGMSKLYDNEAGISEICC